MYRIKFLITVFLFSLCCAAQLPLSENASVSVLTCGSGNEMYSLFGHTAIRIKDPANNIDVVYNYGAFDFRTPNFVLKFTKGDMQYFVTSDFYQDFIDQYHYEKRNVSEQTLDIPLAKKQQLFEKLNTVLFSDERFYIYKFIDRNCTNMAVDVINETLGEKAIYKRRNTDETYRETLFPYFNDHFYEQLGTSIIFGAKVDRQATLLFLPTEFEQSLTEATYRGKPLAEKIRPLLKMKKPEPEGRWWNNIYTYLLILALVVVINRKPLTLGYLTLISLFGVFFSIAGWYSLHEEVARNYNVLLFNPILLVLSFFWLRKKARPTEIVSIIYLASVGIYLFVVAGKVYFWIILPVIATNVILVVRIWLKSRKPLAEN